MLRRALLTSDLRRRALVFALDVHGAQRYGHHPYVAHVFDVHNVLLEFGVERDEVLAAALLHAVIQDTPVRYDRIDQLFGREVAEIVYTCTDDLGRDRRERASLTMKRFRQWMSEHGTAALTVKLADWIANVRDAVRREAPLDRYQREWRGFALLRTIHPPGEEPHVTKMWQHLELLLFERTS